MSENGLAHEGLVVHMLIATLQKDHITPQRVLWATDRPDCGPEDFTVASGLGWKGCMETDERGSGQCGGSHQKCTCRGSTQRWN